MEEEKKMQEAVEDKRPSWDEYFMEMAELTAQRSTCLRRHVGAVIVRDMHAMATGYNGAPKGLKHCAELGGCLREKLHVPSGERHELCRALHAEQNAIIQAAALGQSIEGGTIYITNHPCSICAKMIVNAGIKRIVIREGYPDELAKDILGEAGITVERLEKEK
jgi:dCMP deaminase